MIKPNELFSKLIMEATIKITGFLYKFKGTYKQK